MACPVCKLDPTIVEEVNRRLRAGFSYRDITLWLRENHPILSGISVEHHHQRVKRAAKCPA